MLQLKEKKGPEVAHQIASIYTRRRRLIFQQSHYNGGLGQVKWLVIQWVTALQCKKKMSPRPREVVLTLYSSHVVSHLPL